MTGLGQGARGDTVRSGLACARGASGPGGAVREDKAVVAVAKWA